MCPIMCTAACLPDYDDAICRTGIRKNQGFYDTLFESPFHGGCTNGFRPETRHSRGSEGACSGAGASRTTCREEEPMIGRLFGEFYAGAPKENLRSADFVMGDPIRKGWIGSIRNFVLDGARYSNPRLGAEEYLVIKEPNGSVGALLLMEALPESRMILLVRDPRDVVASLLDAAREGGWLYESREGRKGKRLRKIDRRPNSFVRERAKMYRRGVENAGLAYDAHEGPKGLARYEELRADTLGEMKRIYSVLGISVEEEELRRAVEKHSWENVPEEEKGRGKFYRRGTPGGWKE